MRLRATCGALWSRCAGEITAEAHGRSGDNRRMPSTTYGAVLRLPGVARLFVVSFLARIPAAMVGVVLTLHVVSTLDRGYGQAGVVVGAATVGMALGAPWRGRLVDRLGLRRAIAPSVVVESAVWLVAPHLILRAAHRRRRSSPGCSSCRSSRSAGSRSRSSSRSRTRRPAFSLDSVAVELTFMLSPVVGVLLATQASTSVALTVVGALTVAGGRAAHVGEPADPVSARLHRGRSPDAPEAAAAQSRARRPAPGGGGGVVRAGRDRRVARRDAQRRRPLRPTSAG